MTVGESLAAARSRAGLSVDELSERTRIRETVIRCIEQDDYDSCGGDLFVRGYVRALAGAVGIDAQPLIREYDKTHAESPDTTATDTTGGTSFAHVVRVADPVPPVDPAETSADLPVADPDVTAADLPVVSEDPMPTVADLPVIPAGPEPTPPAPRSRPSRQRPAQDQGRRGRRRRAARIAIPAVLVLAVAGIASGLVVSSQSAPPSKNAAAVTQHSAAPHPSKPPASASPAPTASTPAPSPSPSVTPLAAVTSLPIAQAVAFGPQGTADGDNPQIAGRVLTDPALGWVSQWYATAVFGSLKQGTGLLIDMGRQVTVTSVRIDLAGYRGADLQLRTGDTAATPSDLRIAARVTDVGGTVRIQLQAPERTRYVLIWFTLLPPNGAGQYQATVYHVVVDGRR